MALVHDDVRLAEARQVHAAGTGRALDGVVHLVCAYQHLNSVSRFLASRIVPPQGTSHSTCSQSATWPPRRRVCLLLLSSRGDEGLIARLLDHCRNGIDRSLRLLQVDAVSAPVREQLPAVG